MQFITENLFGEYFHRQTCNLREREQRYATSPDPTSANQHYSRTQTTIFSLHSLRSRKFTPSAVHCCQTDSCGACQQSVANSWCMGYFFYFNQQKFVSTCIFFLFYYNSICCLQSLTMEWNILSAFESILFIKLYIFYSFAV